MENMGLELLFKGNNFLRLWGGYTQDCTDFHAVFTDSRILPWNYHEDKKSGIESHLPHLS